MPNATSSPRPRCAPTFIASSWGSRRVSGPPSCSWTCSATRPSRRRASCASVRPPFGTWRARVEGPSSRRKERGMPDVQEVFRMATTKVRPEAGFVDRQHREQRRRNRNRRLGSYALVALIALVGGAVVLRSIGDGSAPKPAVRPSPVPVEVATGFVEAYGAFDADRSISFLADEADISVLLIGPVPDGVNGLREELARN